MNNLDLLIPGPPPEGTRYEAATVTQTSPLRIRLDGQASALASDVIDWVGGPYTVGDRVLCLWLGARVSVIARAGSPGLTPWTSYTPTLTNMSKGDGILTAKHRVEGGRRRVMIDFALGSTSTIGNVPVGFSLPSEASGITTGTCYLGDVNVDGYVGFFIAVGSTVYLKASPTGYVSTHVPFEWTHLDTILLDFTYPED